MKFPKKLELGIKKQIHLSDAQIENQRKYNLKKKQDDLVHKQQPQLEALFYQWRNVEFAGMVFSICGLIIAIIEYEIDIGNGGYKGLGLLPDTGVDTNGEIEKAIHDRVSDSWTTTLRLLNCLSCFLTLSMLFLRRYLKTKWINTYFNEQLKREKMNVPYIEFCSLDALHNEDEHLRTEVRNTSFLQQAFIIECCAQVIFPWPYVDSVVFMPQYAVSQVDYVPYFTSDLIMLFMFWRVYTVLRHFERYHEFTDMYSKKVCRTYGFYPGRMFTLKIELLSNPTRMTLILFFKTIFLLAFVVRVFELPYEDNQKIKSLDLQNYGSAVYMTVITLTTVGYGDLYPHTSGGQVVCMFIALWGTFVVSLLVLVAASIFELKPNENKAIRFIKQSRTASKSILLALRFFIKKKNYYIHRMKIDQDFVVNSTFLKMIQAQEQLRHSNTKYRFKDIEPTLFDHVQQNRKERELLKNNQQNKLLVQLKQKVEADVNKQITIKLGQEMNETFIKLQESLKDFNDDKVDYDKLLDENEVEMLHSNRVIKKEVIDMSDVVEKMSQIILTQNQKIDQQGQDLKEIKSILLKESREDYENEKQRQIHEKKKIQQDKFDKDTHLPELFSIRRSPYYQTKIIQRQLNDEILNTNKPFKEQVKRSQKISLDEYKMLEKKNQ